MLRSRYRPDIDGLRAIAILAVIGFHGFPEWCRGGFAGVDVFFVISGFLISSIVFGSLQQDQFSFFEFYSRRIRRIFPALALTLGSCLAVGWFFLSAPEYKQLGKYAASGAAFVANFTPLGEAGYFDVSATIKPLWHLWSLGIEEQFYILFPAIWFISRKLKINLLLTTLGLALLSFGANIAQIKNHSETVFFLPHFRFWELLTGSILAWFSLQRVAPVSATLGEENRSVGLDILSVVGFILTLSGVCFLNSTVLFPGWAALVPVIGALLLIWAGKDAVINRMFLSHPILVGIGLISYPLYLWHYPLLSFAVIFFGKTPPLEYRVILIAVTFLLAWLTYVLIERPFRVKLAPKFATGLLVIFIIVIGLFGYYVSARDGFPKRIGKEISVQNQGDTKQNFFFDRISARFYPCGPEEFRQGALPFQKIKRCFQSKKSDKREIAIIGDSHAEHIFLGLAQRLPSANIVYYIDRYRFQEAKKDTRLRKAIEYVSGDNNIRKVLICWQWYRRSYGTANREQLRNDLDWIVGELTKSGKQVYLIYDIPEFPFSAENCKYKRSAAGHARCEEARGFFDNQRTLYADIFQAIKNKYPSLKLIDPAQYFCDEKTCFMARDGWLFYRDEGHLNVYGSEYWARKVLKDYPDLAK